MSRSSRTRRRPRSSASKAATRADYSSSGHVDAYKLGGDRQITPGHPLARLVRTRRLRAERRRAVAASGRWASRPATDLVRRFERRSPFRPRRPTKASPVRSVQQHHPVRQLAAQHPVGRQPRAEARKPRPPSRSAAVFTPTFLPGFNLSVDWFDIDVKGVITTGCRLVVLDTCATNPTGHRHGLADLLQPDPLRPERPAVRHRLRSACRSSTFCLSTPPAGVDMEANYRANLSDWGMGDHGSLVFNLVGTYTEKLFIAGAGRFVVRLRRPVRHHLRFADAEVLSQAAGDLGHAVEPELLGFNGVTSRGGQARLQHGQQPVAAQLGCCRTRTRGRSRRSTTSTPTGEWRNPKPHHHACGREQRVRQGLRRSWTPTPSASRLRPSGTDHLSSGVRLLGRTIFIGVTADSLRAAVRKVSDYLAALTGRRFLVRTSGGPERAAAFFCPNFAGRPEQAPPSICCRIFRAKRGPRE